MTLWVRWGRWGVEWNEWWDAIASRTPCFLTWHYLLWHCLHYGATYTTYTTALLTLLALRHYLHYGATYDATFRAKRLRVSFS